MGIKFLDEKIFVKLLKPPSRAASSMEAAPTTALRVSRE
jgi:hypothetical protein